MTTGADVGESQRNGKPTILVVTATYPWGKGEGFLTAELRQIADRSSLLIVPVRAPNPAPTGNRAHLERYAVVRRPVSPRVVIGALTECILHPIRTLLSLRELWRGNANDRWKNFLVLPKALWMARLARRHGIEHIHAYWASVPATIAMIAASHAKVGWSMTAHRGDVAVRNLLRSKVLSARRVRCISEATRKMLEEAVGAETLANLPRRPVVIHLGVEVPPDSRVPSKRTGATLLCVAQMLPLKRHVDILEAVRLLVGTGTECVLELIGDGPEEASLRELTREMGIETRVRFRGHLSHSGVLSRMEDREVVGAVLASEIEGVPASLMEAMAVGLPAICTDVGGVSELLGDGAGLLVAPGSPSALATAMQAVLADSSSREMLGAAGRQRILTEFDSSVSAVRILAGVLNDGDV